MLRRTVFLAAVSLLAACNQETASAPVSTSGPPAPAAVSLADFKGEWAGKSLAGANLRLIVGDRVGFEYGNVPTNTGDPQFIGKKMRVPFTAAGGWIEVSKRSATTLDWEFSGNASSPNKSWATLTLVK